jgi:hypothetical protein
MKSKKAKVLSVPIGMVNYNIPSPEAAKKRKAAEDTIKLLSKATWSIPGAMRSISTQWDGSFYIYAMVNDPEVKKIRDQWNEKEGIRFHVVEDWSSKNPEETAEIVRSCIARSLGEIIGQKGEGGEEPSGLRGSLAKLKKRYEELEAGDADGLIVDRIHEAKAKLEDAMVVAASFALTEEYEEMRKTVAATVEAELELARVDAGKVQLERMKAAGVI